MAVVGWPRRCAAGWRTGWSQRPFRRVHGILRMSDVVPRVPADRAGPSPFSCSSPRWSSPARRWTAQRSDRVASGGRRSLRRSLPRRASAPPAREPSESVAASSHRPSDVARIRRLAQHRARPPSAAPSAAARDPAGRGDSGPGRVRHAAATVRDEPLPQGRLRGAVHVRVVRRGESPDGPQPDDRRGPPHARRPGAAVGDGQGPELQPVRWREPDGVDGGPQRARYRSVSARLDPDARRGA